MDFLISFMVALVIMLLVGVVRQGLYKFIRRNRMPEGWRESETQQILREAQEKEQWENSLQATKEQGEKVTSAVVVMHHKLSH
jgi:Na+-transporting methylmalonyl-CoA/oxaloacetate decarboxylase gamma subunit